MIGTGDLLGTSQVGVHLAVVGNVLFAPIQIEKERVEEIANALELEPVQMSIGGSGLLGALVAGNQHGIAVADIANDEDIDRLTSYGDVIVMESSVNAAGNLLLVNDQGAIASPILPDEGLDVISEMLKVDVAAVAIAGSEIPGGAGVCNNKGVLLHPDVTEGEVEIIEDILGVRAMVGTVSFGSPNVGSGCVASDHGAWVGAQTAGPELNRIEDALDLI